MEQQNAERVTVASTAAGSHKTARAIGESAAVLGYESSHQRPPDGLAVGFVDYPFRDPTATFAEHLAAVEAEQPAIAVAPDLDATREPATVYEQADRLLEHAGAVVVATKREDTHPEDVPDRFRVGVPLQGNDDEGEQADLYGDATDPDDAFAGSTPWRIADYRDAGSVHLLGASPNVHREVAKYVEVASVDTSTPERVAKHGDYWTPEKWTYAGENADLYDTIRASLDEMVAWWADRYGYPSPVEPEPPRELVREGPTEQEPRVADPSDALGYGAPPEPADDDRDLWSGQDYRDGAVPGVSAEQAAEYRENREANEQAAIESVRQGAATATDGGEEADPKMSQTNDSEAWADAVAYVREHYPESYQGRIEFSSDINKSADSEGVPRLQAYGDEGVTQPLLRFQDIPPGDVYNQIENKAGEDTAKDVRKGLIAFAEMRGARSDDGGDGPRSPVISGVEAAANLVVGSSNFGLPEPWDGWADVVAVGQNVDTSGDRGDYVAYVSPSRMEALVFEGTVTSNKWSLSAWRYAERLPEDPDASAIQFGPSGTDGPDEKVKLTHGNTPTAEGWDANTEHFLTVEGVREEVPKPNGDEGDPYDPTTEFSVEKQDRIDAGVEPEAPTEDDGKQVTLTGSDMGDDVALPKAWTRSGAGTGTKWTAGPLSVRITGNSPGDYRVALMDENHSEGPHTVASEIESADLAVEVAERFTSEVAPPEVSLHSAEMGPVNDATAEAKQVIHEANHGAGLGAFTDDGGEGWVDDSPAMGEKRVWLDGGSDSKSNAVIEVKPSFGSYLIKYRSGFKKATPRHSWDEKAAAVEHAEAVMEEYTPEEFKTWVTDAAESADVEEAPADPIGTPDDGDQDDDGTPHPDPSLVKVDLSKKWDASTARTAANDMEMQDLAATFSEAVQADGSEVAITREEAQSVLDNLVARSTNLEPDGFSIMGADADTIRRRDSAAEAFEAVEGISASDQMGREALASKAATSETDEQREGFVTEMMADLEDGLGLTPFDIAGESGNEFATEDQDRPDRRAREEADLAALAGDHDEMDTEQPNYLTTTQARASAAGDALGRLRMDYGSRREDLQNPLESDDREPIYRDDLSRVIRRVNEAKNDAGASNQVEVMLSDDDLAVLWAATAHLDGLDGARSPKLGAFESDMAAVDMADDESDEQAASEPAADEADEEPTEGPEADSGEADGSEMGRGESVEFNTLKAANEWRDSAPEGALHPEDTRRPKTVRLHPDADESTVQDAEGAALTTFADETPNYGQEKLTDDEREKLDARDGWTWGSNGFEAMSVKAALQAEGAADWLNYYEKNEGVGGSLKNMEAGKQATAERGTANAMSGERQDNDEMSRAEAAAKVEKGEGQACDNAVEGCESGYEEACRQLREDCGYSQEEVDALQTAIEDAGEDPAAVLGAEPYQPTEDMSADPGERPGPNGETGHLNGPNAASEALEGFEEWAADAEPEQPPEASDEELADLAPAVATADDYRPEVLERNGIEMGDGFEFEPLPTGASRVIGKAWSGYKLARVEATDAIENAESYAQTINGVRMANGLRPLEFNELEGLAEQAHVPEDPTEEYATDDGKKRSLLDAMKQGALDVAGGDVYDPTSEL